MEEKDKEYEIFTEIRDGFRHTFIPAHGNQLNAYFIGKVLSEEEEKEFARWLLRELITNSRSKEKDNKSDDSTDITE